MADLSRASDATGDTAHRLSTGHEMKLGLDYCTPSPDLHQPRQLCADVPIALEKSYRFAEEDLGHQRKRAKYQYDRTSVEQRLQKGDLVRTKARTGSLGTPSRFAPNWSGLQEIVKTVIFLRKRACQNPMSCGNRRYQSYHPLGRTAPQMGKIARSRHKTVTQRERAPWNSSWSRQCPLARKDMRPVS